jgi:kynurenine 3-monooxygenase
MSMTVTPHRIDRSSPNIVGAGPTGVLLAILLRRRGLAVTVYDSRADPRGRAGEAGRSINLALADRGIHALKVAGVYDALAGELMAMRGRMVHQRDGQSLQLYGGRPNEVIYSISRHRLNQALLHAASRHAVKLRFEHALEDIDFERGTARLRDKLGGRVRSLPLEPPEPLLAADGAGSLTRRRMSTAGLIPAREVDLDHGYKELSIPAGPAGAFRMAHDALHIWPRGNFMLIALPNTDGSFTATLFLSMRGAVSFEALTAPVDIERFLGEQFPDACALMPDRVAEFQQHPIGFLGTVYADKWNVGGMVGLIGDAAHAIVPFHGQGMNCCFEDCLQFDACFADACAAQNAGWQSVFERFFAARKANTDAIARMALENYLEMRERVADPQFRLQQTLALELERRHPQRFVPRYSMVMFHHEISYRTALERGLVQNRLLAELTAGRATLDDIDFELAGRQITRELKPLAREPAQA